MAKAPRSCPSGCTVFARESYYQCRPEKGPYVFILSGTSTYGELRGFVARGANEDGSDGTIRAAAASLNSIKLAVDYTRVDPDAVRRGAPVDPEVAVTAHAHQRIAFAVAPGLNHTTIVPGDDDGVFDRIVRCLGVRTDAEYQALRDEFDADNERFYAEQRQQQGGVGRYQQFVVRMLDDMGNPVKDYRLDFHAVDPTITSSAWQDDRHVLNQLKQYQAFTERLNDEVIADTQPHSTEPHHRTFYVNYDRLADLRAELRRHPSGPFIAMNIDAVGPTPDLGYGTDVLKYLSVEVDVADGGQSFTFFAPNTTTLVDIRLQRVPSESIFRIVNLADVQ